MLATVMNSLALADAMRQAGLTARVMSAIGIEQVVEQHSVGDAAIIESVPKAHSCLSIPHRIVSDADAGTDIVLVARMIGDVGLRGKSRASTRAGVSSA